MGCLLLMLLIIYYNSNIGGQKFKVQCVKWLNARVSPSIRET